MEEEEHLSLAQAPQKRFQSQRKNIEKVHTELWCLMRLRMRVHGQKFLCCAQLGRYVMCPIFRVGQNREREKQCREHGIESVRDKV